MEEDDLESSSDPSSFLIAEESTGSGGNDTEYCITCTKPVGKFWSKMSRRIFAQPGL